MCSVLKFLCAIVRCAALVHGSFLLVYITRYWSVAGRLIRLLGSSVPNLLASTVME
jgi:hypothetical protein